ncbi:hypothetical protein PENSPDRAFT_757822 [Peniophora sp. CONT]|nr:hypothetical protein PENSPDRAFT_757822 [Peniophora sp. CONT]
MSAYQGSFSAHIAVLGLQRLQEIGDLQFSRHSSEEDIAALGVQLEEDAQSLHTLAARLLHRRNFLLSPLLRLPVELIQHIICFAAKGQPMFSKEDSETSDDESSESAADDPLECGWVPLGHVSSHIRTILLAMREVWASAICSAPRRYVLEEVTRRAGDAPLSLRLDGDTSSFVWPFALQNLHKAGHIDIKFFDDDDHAIYETLCELEIPLLQSMRLSISETSNYFDVHQMPWMRGFEAHPASAPYMNAPNLRTLQLENVFLPFNPSTLTTLTLIGSISFWSEVGESPNPSTFLDMLRLCSQLHTLRVVGWVPDFRDDVTYLPASLPRLKTLSLELNGKQLASIWSHLNVPGSTSVIVDVCSQNKSQKTFPLATRLRSVPLFSSHVRSVDISGLSIRHEHDYLDYGPDTDNRFRDRLRIVLLARAAGTNDQVFIDLPRPHPFELDHRVLLSVKLHNCTARTPANDIEAAMRRLASEFRLSQLDTLGVEIRHHAANRYPLQVAISRCFPSIHTLCVYDRRLDASVVEPNLIRPIHNGDKDPPHFVNPSLRTVYIPHPKQGRYYISELRKLAQAIKARIKAGGSRISVVHISCTGFQSREKDERECLAILREVVPEIRSVYTT